MASLAMASLKKKENSRLIKFLIPRIPPHFCLPPAIAFSPPPIHYFASSFPSQPPAGKKGERVAEANGTAACSSCVYLGRGACSELLEEYRSRGGSARQPGEIAVRRLQS